MGCGSSIPCRHHSQTEKQQENAAGQGPTDAGPPAAPAGKAPLAPEAYKPEEVEVDHDSKDDHIREVDQPLTVLQENIVKAHVWPIPESQQQQQFVYPELSDSDYGISFLKDKLDFGIAISGGGLRATVCALGWLRGLYMMGVMQRARFLSTCSGSSWLNSALSFHSDTSIEKLLGPYFAPEECNIAELRKQQEEGSYGHAISNAPELVAYMRELMADGFKSPEAQALAWTNTVAHTFLQPVKAHRLDATFTAMCTRGSVHNRVLDAVKAQKLGVACALKDPILPYPIMVASLTLQGTPEVFFPLEVSPLYVGVPVAYPNATPVKLGAGYVEPLGFHSCLRSHEPAAPVEGSSSGASGEEAEVQSTAVVPLADFVASSSSYIMQKLRPGASRFTKLLGLHKYQYWNQQDWQGAEVACGDGVGSDNLAIYPLLRRKVARILVCVATSKVITATSPPQWAALQSDVAAVFGSLEKGVDGVDIQLKNKMAQVFEASGFSAMHSDLMAKDHAGEPLIHRASYTVLDNPHMGVQGGWQAEVLWVFNAEVRQWEEQLPEDTRHQIQYERTSRKTYFEGRAKRGAGVIPHRRIDPVQPTSFSMFPLVSTNAMSYSPELVGALSNLSCWVILQTKSTIMSLMNS